MGRDHPVLPLRQSVVFICSGQATTTDSHLRRYLHEQTPQIHLNGLLYVRVRDDDSRIGLVQDPLKSLVRAHT